LRLSVRGWTVTVCEAGSSFGGKMNCHREGGYTFDTGPSLITMPDVFEELYRAAGERLEDHITLVRMDPHAEYRFADGAKITCPCSTAEWRDTIRQVEPRDVAGFDQLHALGRKLYELSRRTFFRRSPFERPDLAGLAALRFLPVSRGWGNYADTVAGFFRSPWLRQIYNRYPTYVGSSPYSCPATLLIIPFLERDLGAWYVRGGLYKIVESLVGLALRQSVELRANSRVTEIETSRGAVLGVRLEDGSRLAADAVVMNGDVATAGALLGDQLAYPELSDRPASRSLSGLVLLRGVRMRPPGLGHHTVLFSSDYRAEFDDLFALRRFPAEPTVYISAPAASDPSVAPPGGDALFIMANAPANSEDWTQARVDAATRRVSEVVSRAGINADAAEVASVWSPARLARTYLAPGGAIYGTHSHGWKHAFLRPPNRSAKVGGLYFVGGSTHPGGGTPTVLMSARITAEMLLSAKQA
ncbi:MAG: Zeta-carotene-forming phytoene desaturase, partial [Bryobacterales bacterium]|nr:Zeta-carotene-forming phytoene desaturase [Bryobacterales bacterium]